MKDAHGSRNQGSGKVVWNENKLGLKIKIWQSKQRDDCYCPEVDAMLQKEGKKL